MKVLPATKVLVVTTNVDMVPNRAIKKIMLRKTPSIKRREKDIHPRLEVGIKEGNKGSQRSSIKKMRKKRKRQKKQLLRLNNLPIGSRDWLKIVIMSERKV